VPESDKFISWLGEVDGAIERGEFWNASHQLAHLTAAGTVLDDQDLVFVAEFLEWLLNNLRPGLAMKSESFERTESVRIAREAISKAVQAIREPGEIQRNYASFRGLRFEATRLQLSRLAGQMHRSSLASVVRRLEE